MLINNRWAVLVLGVLVGAAINIGYVGAQAYLLSITKPVYALYGAFAAGASFTIFLRFFHSQKLKFAWFGVWGTFFFLGLLLFLTTDWIPDSIRAVGWFFVAMLGVAFFRWVVSELAIKHLDPARAQAYFSYLVTAMEVGMILALVGLKSYTHTLTPVGMIFLSLLLFSLIALFLWVQFCPKRNFEIKYSKKEVETPAIPEAVFKPLVVLFVVLLTFLGAFKASEDYLIKVVLKQELIHFEAIKEMITNYMLVGSVVIIGVSAIVGAVIDRNRVSPLKLFYIQLSLLSVVAVVCLSTKIFYAFVAFEVLRRVCESSFFTPANQMVVSAFVGKLRHRLRSTSGLFYYALSGIPLIILFSYLPAMYPDSQVDILLFLILGFLIFSGFALVRFGKIFIKNMYHFAGSEHKTAAVVAVQTLSFLRPKTFKTQMKGLLEKNPKKILRKNIILGLGYAKTEGAVNTILEQFESEEEEIQMAVLDALKMTPLHRATQFLANIVMNQVSTKSLRVRLNATKIIAGIYGRKAIPFLLNGLDDEDPRVVANTLETLTLYKDPHLIYYFEKFSHSDIPRVRANALMGLASFRRTKAETKKVIDETFGRKDSKMLSSILFAIGRIRDKGFLKQVQSLEANVFLREELKNTLSWALTRLGEESGNVLLGELLSLPYQKEKPSPILHFFAQLSGEERYDVLSFLARHFGNNRESLKNIGDNLKYSRYDFHEELDYFNVIAHPG